MLLLSCGILLLELTGCVLAQIQVAVGDVELGLGLLLEDMRRCAVIVVMVNSASDLHLVASTGALAGGDLLLILHVAVACHVLHGQVAGASLLITTDAACYCACGCLQSFGATSHGEWLW